MLAAGAAAVLVLLTGCSSTGDGAAGGAGGADGVSSVEGGPPAPAGDVAAEAVDDVSGGGGSRSGGALVAQQVISTGNVQLRSDDVGQSIFEVRKVVDAHGGSISEDNTETDKRGEALRSRMVLRIPTSDFGTAMAELERAATLVASKRQSADVTTEVLDIDARVEAQQRSIDRIQVLFDSATSIKDVVSVEGELSRRQADLASLLAQQRYLADQTSMSTITVTVERTRDQATGEPETDHTGFLAGLSGGWKALQTFLVAVATVVGALLPWLLLALVLALPLWALARRLRRQQPSAT